MNELRLVGAQETESRSTINGQATSSSLTTIHAAQGVTVVLTVAVDDARLARSVAIQWHRTRQGLHKTGRPPADGLEFERATTITYDFAADRPGTFTYHARYGRDLVHVRGSKTGPPADGRARTAGTHGVLNVPPRDEGSATGGSARTAVLRRHGDRRARGSRGRASVEAQLMADCPVIYYNHAEYDGGPPVLRLLRWSAAALAAAALWVSGICGPGNPDTHRRASQHPATLC